jgi:glycine/D-amino acid oxidase-like deaminating enzyme
MDRQPNTQDEARAERLQENLRDLDRLIYDQLQSLAKLIISFNGAGLLAISAISALFHLDIASVKNWVLATGASFVLGAACGAAVAAAQLSHLITTFKYLAGIAGAEKFRALEGDHERQFGKSGIC